MKLSLIVLTTESRKEMFSALKSEIHFQAQLNGLILNHDYELIVVDDETDNIGSKRNKGLGEIKGDYFAFIDDDDMISKCYIETGIKVWESKCDCGSLRGVITWNGQNPELFEHSIRYKEYKTTNNTIKYERYPNHLNFIKSEIGKQFKFPETNHGEDTDWATQIHNSGLIKSEYYTDKVLYNYLYIPNK